jgi:Membrane domain of glycerophosphoryl diester phosphodiesterase
MSDQPGWSAPDQGASPPPPPPPPPPGWSNQPPTGPPPSWAGYTPAAPYGGYAYGQAAAAPKPGVIPLRPLGVGEILDGALSTVRANWKVMLGSALVVVGVGQVVSFLLNISVLGNLGSSSTFDDNGVPRTGFGGGGIVVLLLSIGVQYAALLVLGGLCTVVVGRAVLGEQPTFAVAWAQLRPHLLKLFGVAILTTLAVIAGLVLCIVGAVWVGVGLAVAVPALILERGRVTESLGRSWNLVQGGWWRTFGILLLGVVIIYVIQLAVSIPLLVVSFVLSGVFSDPSGPTSLVPVEAFSALAGIIAGTITYPFQASMTALIYVDRRMRKEGLDLELQRASGTTPAPPTPAPGYEPPANAQPGYSQQPGYPPPPPGYPPPPPSYAPQYQQPYPQQYPVVPPPAPPPGPPPPPQAPPQPPPV